MPAICIPKEIVERVKKVDLNLSTIEREKELTKLLGDETTAREINKLYEESRLLSNQKTSFDKFIDNISGVSVEKKAKLKEQIATRLANRKTAIQDKELLTIAKDIYDRKYDLGIDLEDIKILNTIKRDADALKLKITGDNGSASRMAYGRRIVDLSDAVQNLKNPNEKLGIIDTTKNLAKGAADKFSKDKGITGNIGEGLKLTKDVLTSAIYKSVQASLDASFALRQGFKILTKSPKAWADNMKESFKAIAGITSKSKLEAVSREFKARLVSHPLYDEAIKAKLGIGVVEEFFPTTLAEKIPLLGNAFKSSNEAFTIFSQGSRMSLFEDMVKTATKNGTELTPKLMQDLAYVANSITGRGNLGKLEASSETINKLLFSGRFIKSQLDTFTMPFNTALAPEAKKEALKSSVANLSAIAGLMATASMFTDVEWDMRSSKFGKMKVPGSSDTWVDITGGLASYIVLATRIAKFESKSATSGKVTELNTGEYGARTAFDVMTDFAANKLAPAPSAAVSYLKGKTFEGKKPTLGGTALNLATPISLGNAYDIFTNEDTAAAFTATVFDVLGAGATDYTKFK